MPDFFDGAPFDVADFPPQTESQKARLNAFFGGAANPEKAQNRIPGYLRAAEEEADGSSIKSWGALGYCWGGKMVSLASASSSPSSDAGSDGADGKVLFRAAAQSSPAMVDAKDAEKIRIPMCMLASGDESTDDVAAYEKALAGVKRVETFPGQLHGFMSTRADLKDEAVRKEYERGYQILLAFFNENM